ncbi:threonine/serine dehydratase [Aliiruegeria sabulilitoris]|uniref:threonine/serine dehydratase n=1 Tax=Aliiruegeria sabulilitoris TaxID=1510458 RepID=UPI0008357543|nr:threonine/serine dehydratase [Aliiruegeria sabulilitoris]NDR57678.1 threonine/serine dehydratase [Pseudoruegeria sp. M32A2M]
MNDWKERIDAAADRTAGLLRRTPLMETRALWNEKLVEIKLEQMQHTGAFKPRGAFNTLLSNKVPDVGVVAASGGNHGAAVAYAAAKLGMKARIFVPELAGRTKISLIEQYGADLVVVPGSYAEALEAARAWEADTGALQVHAYDSPETVEGQGTLFREWEGQGLEADTILVAVGGGGLIAGAMAWFEEERKVVAVEPEGCATLTTAMREGVDAEVDVSGVAANALGARKIGKICHQLAVEQLVETAVVSDAAILEAQKLLWQKLRLLVEPAGATALAALRSGAYQPEPGERVALVLCGANVEPDPLGVA